MTLAELIEVVVEGGTSLEFSHERDHGGNGGRGRIQVQALTRANLVEGKIVVDLDDEDESFTEALENFLCRFW